MKKFLVTMGKTVVFFIVWALLAGLLPIPNSDNGAVWRFWAELIPFLCIVGLTAIFLIIDRKNNVKLHFISNVMSNVAIGIVSGIVWIGIVAAIFFFTGTMKIVDYNTISMFWLWIISVFINTVMQELLVRGYLYQMIKEKYNQIIAAVVTTVLFTFMHGGAFEAGVIPVLNVLSMSILMTCVLEYTNSVMAPIIMHFAWNFVGAILLGGVSLADDYPNLCNSQFVGNILLTGGNPKMEGSIIVLIVNCIFIIIFAFLIMKKGSSLARTKKYSERNMIYHV